MLIIYYPYTKLNYVVKFYHDYMIQQNINPLSTKNADDKIYVCEISENVSSKPNYIEHSKTRANNVDQDEVAHHEPPHQDLHCLQTQLFSSPALLVLIDVAFFLLKKKYNLVLLWDGGRGLKVTKPHLRRQCGNKLN